MENHSDNLQKICDEHNQIDHLLREKEIFKNGWIDLLNKMLAEVEKDGWCRLVATKEDVLKTLKRFKSI